jgi:hypothetical protein
MTTSSNFTPSDFMQLARQAGELARQAAEHEAELKIRLAKAGVNGRSDRDHRDPT